MNWKHGPQDLTKLQQLGLITARLLRLMVYQKVTRGDSQLRAHGIPSQLASIYAEHAKSERHILIPEKPRNFVRFTSHHNSEF